MLWFAPELCEYSCMKCVCLQLPVLSKSVTMTPTKSAVHHCLHQKSFEAKEV